MQLSDFCKGLFFDLFLTKTNLRVMKLSAVLLLVCGLQASADTDAQTISFSGKEVPILRVLSEVKKQTGYVIFCSYDLLHRASSVTVNAKNVPVEEFMDMALKG